MDPEMLCDYCGRRMTDRRRWRNQPQPARFCSRRCRTSRRPKLDTAIETALLDLLACRGPGNTICPSEVARSLFPEEAWRGQMETVRCAARRLAAEGFVEITQGGQSVDPSAAKGPIRVRLAERSVAPISRAGGG